MVGLSCGAGLVALSIQWLLMSQLRRENESLRIGQQEVVVTRASDKQVESSAAPGQVPNDSAELVRLRNEVGQLREQLALLKSGHSNAGSALASTPAGSTVRREDEISQLGHSASQGDVAALERLAELSAAAAGTRTNVNQDTHREIRVAFEILGKEAGNGNEAALQALWRATRMEHLEGMAILGLGQAAGMGNEKALEPLLDPERYLLNQASVTLALKPAAESGNIRAIEALAAVVTDPKNQALWFLVADGLQKPAVAGNATAIDELAVLGRAENPNVRRTALRALENAAFNRHTRAADALRSLGYQ